MRLLLLCYNGQNRPARGSVARGSLAQGSGTELCPLQFSVLEPQPPPVNVMVFGDGAFGR